VTRYRADLVAARTAEKQRVEKLLEDAQIKLSVVASDIFGVSGRAMLAALIAGERDPKVLAQLARTRLRAKLSLLEEAFTGFFTDQHAFLLAKMQARLVGACSGGLLLHAMPNPDGLLAAAGMVKVVEQTWRLDAEGPTGNSSARIGERPKIDPGAVQQGREGEAWYIARGRYEHLMVARTHISDGYLARARAIVALARSWRPQEILPGARAWRDAAAAGEGALAGLAGHLAIEPPPGHHGQDADPDGGGPLPAGHAARAGDGTAEREPRPVPAARYRLRLAVAAAARQADTETTIALVREAERRGLPSAELVAVAEQHWPRPPLRTRARRAGQRWATGGARWAWTHRPRRQAVSRDDAASRQTPTQARPR
jgi:hypothetical protein